MYANNTLFNQILTYVNALRRRKVVPVRGDQGRQGISGHQQRVLVFGSVQNELTLWNVFRAALQKLQLLARLLRPRAPAVERIAERLDLT